MITDVEKVVSGVLALIIIVSFPIFFIWWIFAMMFIAIDANNECIERGGEVIGTATCVKKGTTLP